MQFLGRCRALNFTRALCCGTHHPPTDGDATRATRERLTFGLHRRASLGQAGNPETIKQSTRTRHRGKTLQVLRYGLSQRPALLPSRALL